MVLRFLQTLLILGPPAPDLWAYRHAMVRPCERTQLIEHLGIAPASNQVLVDL